MPNVTYRTKWQDFVGEEYTLRVTISLLFESIFSTGILKAGKLSFEKKEGPVPIYLSRYRFGQNDIIVHRESVPFIVPIIPSPPGLVTWLRRDG